MVEFNHQTGVGRAHGKEPKAILWKNRCISFLGKNEHSCHGVGSSRRFPRAQETLKSESCLIHKMFPDLDYHVRVQSLP